ncbi:glcK [Symbiodinium natans]|uniref:GlcK protein n=1 Tax=Symbiodinium natans TaxID=878477 RepID=A0A812RHT3_9DINO|nr:glcK [Symbiodinium natans]
MASEAELPDERLREAIQALLKGRDLAETSLKQVRVDLEKQLGLGAGSLDARREKVKQLVADEIIRIKSEADGKEEEEEEAAEDPPEEAKAKKSSGSKRAREDKKRRSKDAEEGKDGNSGKGKGKIKERQSASMSRQDFMKKAKPILVTVGDKKFKAAPKLFSTGSCGFMASTKVPVEVNGIPLVLQCSLNLPVIGSKEWEE